MDTSKNSEFRDAAQGVRSAGTGMYALLHEDSEHRTTQRCARKNEFLEVS